MSQLDPSHIATVHDVGTVEGVDFLVNEYVEGMTLAAKRLGGALPVFGEVLGPAPAIATTGNRLSAYPVR
jgi:hypothetical protein